jgi:AraC family transcriptional activator of pobA
MDGGGNILYFSVNIGSSTAPRCRKKHGKIPLKPRAARSHTGTIPVFSLYGEARAGGPERFHIEDIRARSERYHWQIKSHQHHGLSQVLFLMDGYVKVRLDQGRELAAAPCAIVVPSGTVHSFEFQPHAHGYVLTVADSDWTRSEAPAAIPHSAGIIDLSEVPDEVAPMTRLLEEIEIEFRNQAVGAAEAIGAMIRAFMIKLSRQSARAANPRDRRRSETFGRFRALVETHFAEHRPVGFYARALHMSESRLNRLCRAAAGKSALAIVQDRLLLEAQRKLTHIAAPVSLLAYELGFSDPAYFWRFFKRRAGITPSQFRERV